MSLVRNGPGSERRSSVSAQDGLRLADETLAEAPWLCGRQPDLLVDSTGRTRLFARTMEIPAELGPRKDVSYFAHYEGFVEHPPSGQVIIGRMDHAGWSWRIPLRDCLSVGVVLNKDEASPLGATPEERLEAAIARDSQLSAAGKDRRRVSEVAVYTNYQLVSARGHGPGWVMTGDAFGFVDPMLSPGMWLALHSAEILSENLDDLPAYTREMRKLIKAWMDLIQYFYDGRMFAMYHTGAHFEHAYPGKISDTIKTYINQKLCDRSDGLGCDHECSLPAQRHQIHGPSRHLESQPGRTGDPLNEVIERIARQYPGRWLQGYARGKLRSDPIFARRLRVAQGVATSGARCRLRHRSFRVLPS